MPQGDSLNERVRTLLNAIKNDVRSDDNRSQYIYPKYTPGWGANFNVGDKNNIVVYDEHPQGFREKAIES